VDLTLRVCDVADDCGARTLTLASPDGALLPPFVPGSHLVMDCGGRLNAYSLLDDGAHAGTYRISVLHCADGGGGSRWVHESLRIGDLVVVSAPRSAFAPVAQARHHLLVAAGIGVTPMLSHVRAAARWGRSFSVLYRYRAGAAAHLDELRDLCGSRLEECTSRDVFDERFSQAVIGQPMGTHLYVCGPAGFAEKVLGAAAAAGWPAARLHSERFSGLALDPGRRFVVRLRESGAVVEVPSGVSLLEALEARGVRVPNRCRQGVCGECRVDVSGGTPEHRDLFLSEAERAANDTVLCCVSRAHDELEVVL
jgi:ferredoxin-NADP reductase